MDLKNVLNVGHEVAKPAEGNAPEVEFLSHPAHPHAKKCRLVHYPVPGLGDTSFHTLLKKD